MRTKSKTPVRGFQKRRRKSNEQRSAEKATKDIQAAVASNRRYKPGYFLDELNKMTPPQDKDERVPIEDARVNRDALAVMARPALDAFFAINPRDCTEMVLQMFREHGLTVVNLDGAYALLKLPR